MPFFCSLVFLDVYKRQAVADEAEADIIVVNTCCFIKDALEESIETILEMSQYKNPDVGLSLIHI